MEDGVYLVQMYSNDYWTFASWDGEVFYLLGNEQPFGIDTFKNIGKYLGKELLIHNEI